MIDLYRFTHLHNTISGIRICLEINFLILYFSKNHMLCFQCFPRLNLDTSQCESHSSSAQAVTAFDRLTASTAAGLSRVGFHFQPMTMTCDWNRKTVDAFPRTVQGCFSSLFLVVCRLSVALGPQLLKNRGYCFCYSWQ